MNDLGFHPPRPRHGLSLCAGGGGLDMGLMLAEPGFHTRCFVEWEPYPRDVLIAGQRAGYFAPAPIWDDLRTFDARPWAGHIDTVLAGYPCQPFSAAGQRKGADDERHLWPEVARVIRECAPEWVFLENVAGHVSLGLETVLRELWDMGFTPAAGLFSAGETGAAHERLRIFIVAHRPRQREREPDAFVGAVAWQDSRGGPGGCGRGFHGELADPGHAKRRSEDAGRHQCDGNDPGRAQGDGRTGECGDPVGHTPGLGRREGRPEPELRSGRDAAASTGGTMADASGTRPKGREQPGSPDEWHGEAAHGSPAERGCPRVHAPGPGDAAAWASVLADAPDLAPAVSLGDCKRLADNLAALVAEGRMEEAAAESRVRRVVDGLASRSRALRLLGNGVMPLQAALAWVTLAGAHGLEPIEWSNAKPARKNFKPAID